MCLYMWIYTPIIEKYCIENKKRLKKGIERTKERERKNNNMS
jgi:hypothetical protein